MKLTEMQLLKGKSETISMSDLRSRPGDIIQQVQSGKTFTITKGNKIVAVLTSPEPTAFELGAEIRRIELAHSEPQRFYRAKP